MAATRVFDLICLSSIYVWCDQIGIEGLAHSLGAGPCPAWARSGPRLAESRTGGQNRDQEQYGGGEQAYAATAGTPARRPGVLEQVDLGEGPAPLGALGTLLLHQLLLMIRPRQVREGLCR